MVAAFDLVVGVAQAGAVAVMDRAGDGEALGEHALPEHVRGDLVLEPAHAFIKIHGGRGTRAGEFDILGKRIRQHDHPAIAREGIPSPGGFDFAEGADVGRPIKFPQRFERLPGMLAGHHIAEPDLPCPALAEHLIDVAAVVGPDLGPAGRISDVDVVSEVLVPAELVEVLLSGFEDRPALFSKFRIADFGGHDLTGFECGVIHSAEPWHDTIPIRIQRVVQRPAHDAVGIPVGFDKLFESLFDTRPDAAQIRVIRGHLGFAIRAEDASGLAVHGEDLAVFSTVFDDACGRKRRAKVHELAVVALDLREEARHRLGVMPDVGAGALATAHALPGPESTVVQEVAGRRGQGRRVRKCAVQEPIRQGGIIPRIAPESGLRGETVEVTGGEFGDGRGVGEPCGVMALASAKDDFRRMGEMPCDEEVDRSRLSGSQGELSSDPADQLLGQRLFCVLDADFGGGTQHGECHRARIGQAREIRIGGRRTVGECDRARAGVCPGPIGAAIHNLNAGLFAFQAAHIKIRNLHRVGIFSGCGLHRLPIDEQANAQSPRILGCGIDCRDVAGIVSPDILASADPEPDKVPLDAKRAA